MLHGQPAAAAGDGPAGRYRLTPRELTVLALLAESLTARAIANRLGISARTVHHHLEHIYRKLEATDRLGAVLRAQAAGLIPQ
ncbi:MAG TPA: helix-turn-helix transcriptional regulator [Streptosporangiaceae bacterium]|nr:helix-turn-helix transcriptional regulator [Streptosporangiaceae bacterium]